MKSYRFFSCLCAVVLLLSASGCGNQDTEPAETDTPVVTLETGTDSYAAMAVTSSGTKDTKTSSSGTNVSGSSQKSAFMGNTTQTTAKNNTSAGGNSASSNSVGQGSVSQNSNSSGSVFQNNNSSGSTSQNNNSSGGVSQNNSSNQTSAGNSGGTIIIPTCKDGIKASNMEEAEKGFVTIDGGYVDVQNAAGNGIEAITGVTLSGCTVNVHSVKKAVKCDYQSIAEGCLITY